MNVVFIAKGCLGVPGGPFPAAVNVGSRCAARKLRDGQSGHTKRTRIRDLLRDRKVTRLLLLSIRIVARCSEIIAEQWFLVAEA
jgi:hypothetical protein